MKTQIIMLFMWITSATLLSINHPNVGGFLFGMLIAGLIINYVGRWAWKKGEDVYDIIFGE